MTEKTDYLRDAGSVRKYVLQTFKELKHGFVKEVDLPTFYNNVDSIDVLYENDLVNGKVGKWLEFIERLKSEVEEYKNVSGIIDFLIEYLFYHLDYIKDRIKPKTIQPPKLIPEFKDYFTADIKDPEGLKEYLKTLHIGKTLAHAIYNLDKKGFSLINSNYLAFLKTLHEGITRDSGLREYYVKMSEYSIDKKLMQSIENELNKYC